MKFRKKPIVVEAWQNTGNSVLPDWVFAACLSRASWDDKVSLVRQVLTVEGPMFVSENDWLIRGVRGEVYPCKPDIFAATYEPVEESKVERGADEQA